MTQDPAHSRPRGRLDPAARDRILAEIARLDTPVPAPIRAPGPSGLAELRAAVLAAQEELAADTGLPGAAVPRHAAGDVAGHAAPAAPRAEPLPETVPAPAEPAPSPAPPAPAPQVPASEPPSAGAPVAAPASSVPVPEPAAPAPPPVPAPLTAPAAGIWSRLRTIPVDAARLDRNLIIAATRTDPAHGAFDVLRTRMVQAMAERGWKRVGITSPTKGCGKSFSALNLTVALSRYGGHRTVLLDLDMRIPALAKYLGVGDPGSMGDMLRGEVAPADHLRRFADNGLRIGAGVAIGLNDRREAYAAELFQDPATAAALARIETELAPDLMLFDMPPVLAQDDVIALRPHYDCVLMIVAGGTTTAREIRESVRRIGEDKPILGVVLNKADGAGTDEYSY